MIQPSASETGLPGVHSPLEAATHYARLGNLNSFPHSASAQNLRSGWIGSSDQLNSADHSVINHPTGGFSAFGQADSQAAASKATKQATTIDALTGVAKGNALVHAKAVNFEPNSSNPLTSTRSRAVGLPYPGKPLQYIPGQPLRFSNAAKQWQNRMHQRGWSIQVDGLYGQGSARICRQFQREKGLAVDGIVGPATWAATFRSNNITTPSAGGTATGHINQQGLNIVKNFEGLRLNAYLDPVGIWTIGYGHTGPEVGPGEVITAAQAEALLKQDLVRFENGVRQLVQVPINSNQFSALVSFAFNVGTGALAQSTLLALLNQRDYQGAADQFSRWVYGGGQVLPGLVSRRNAERALFLTPA